MEKWKNGRMEEWKNEGWSGISSVCSSNPSQKLLSEPFRATQKEKQQDQKRRKKTSASAASPTRLPLGGIFDQDKAGTSS